jgi:hypothetical protein
VGAKRSKKTTVDSFNGHIHGLYAATRLIYISLHIAYLDDEKPVGIMLIAAPGMGKSMLLTRFKSDKILLFNDLTGWGFETVLMGLKRLKLGYIVVPDLLRIMARKRGWESFLTLTNIVLEEGLEALRRFDIDVKFEKPINFGVITAITTDCFKLHRDQFGKTGFGSRFGKFAYNYEKSDLARIEKKVSVKSTFKLPPIKINPSMGSKKSTKITVSPKIARCIQRLGRLMSGNKPPAFRSIDFVRRLTKARAFSEGRTAANMDDIKEIYALIPFFVPPYPTATDLEYFLLMEFDRKILNEAGYSEDEIYDARTRIARKNIRWDLVVNGDIGGQETNENKEESGNVKQINFPSPVH